MKYRKLGKTGLDVSVVGVGTWQYCGDWGRSFTAREVGGILGSAQASGINLVDTAECYGDHRSEQLIGEALPGRRADWLIATKFGHAYDRSGAKHQDFSAAGVREQLAASLKALRTDYVDILLFHSGDNEQLENQDLWAMLSRQREAGLIRYLGLSLHPDIQNNVYQTAKAAEYGLDVIEVLYNRLERTAEDAVLPMCREYGLGVLSRVPLSSGYLSGKYSPDSVFASDDVRESYHNRDERREKLLRAEKIKRYEVPAGVVMAQWAIAWPLRNPTVCSVIGGYKNEAQLQDAVQAAAMAAESGEGFD
ncbi:MAG: aldo/keto reductase [Gracilibacteraceae bacterium]|jgi:aryl-alcohol dehydrogenase-like predicted oxidoreductase|nr:aldo/keto reductase [Gracilibacteraceae bacterium]